MAKVTDGLDPEAEEIKQDGARTVKGLAEVGRELFPLKEKRDAGKKLTKREVKRLELLEAEYRELERNLYELLRPRQRPDPWVQGRDHAHGRAN
jgi:hypothetical protein